MRADYLQKAPNRTPDPPRLRVLQFAVRDESYPRNSRIRSYLRDECGAVVDVVHARPGRRARRYLGCLRAALSIRSKYDLVILSEFSIEMFFASWIAARRSRAKHVVDFFVGLYETEVEDSRRTRSGTIRAIQLRFADWAAVRSASTCLTDTSVRARRFEESYGRTPFMALPVGAPAWAAGASKPRDQERVRFLYYGNYLALHGVPALIRAIDWAGPRASTQIEVVFVGDGPGRPGAEALAATLPFASTIRFIDSVPASDLRSFIEVADVVFGIFGSSAKAQEVIANKTWQGLYAGKTVVTRTSPALVDLEAAGYLPLVTVDGFTPEILGAALLRAIELSVKTDQEATMLVPAHERLEALVQRRYAVVFGHLLASSRARLEKMGGGTDGS